MAGTPLRELLAEFGFRFDQRATEQASTSIAGVVGAARSLGRTLLAGAVARGVQQFVQGMIDVGSELHDTALETGISATELTEWRYAARLSGVEAGQLGSAMGRTALAAARNSPVLRALGVRTRDAGGELRRTSDIFEDAGVAIGSLTNDTERSSRATQLWGRSGRALIPMFRAGRQGVADLREEVRRLYGTDLEQLAEQSDAAGDAQDRLDLVWDAMTTRVGVFLIPAITSLLEGAVDLANGFADVTRNSSIVQAAFVVLAAVAVGAAVATIGVWGPPLLLFLLLAAAIGVIVLAVDDVITMFRGGRSVIGEFIDSIAGAGTATEWVHTLTEAWEGFTLSVRNAQQAIDEFVNGRPDDPGTGSVQRGDVRSFSRGLDPSTGISAEEDQRRAAIAAVFRGESGAGLRLAEFQRLHPQDGPSAISAPRTGGGETSVTQTTHVGAIHVTGARDPVETARAVRAELESAGADAVDDAAHDLVPAGP